MNNHAITLNTVDNIEKIISPGGLSIFSGNEYSGIKYNHSFIAQRIMDLGETNIVHIANRNSADINAEKKFTVGKDIFSTASILQGQTLKNLEPHHIFIDSVAISEDLVNILEFTRNTNHSVYASVYCQDKFSRTLNQDSDEMNIINAENSFNRFIQLAHGREYHSLLEKFYYQRSTGRIMELSFDS